MLEKLQKLILGTVIKNENFTLNQLPEAICIFFISIFIVFFTPFLGIIDSMIMLANEEGLKHLALSSFKSAFITVPIQLIIISFFSEVKRLKKYGLAFGFIYWIRYCFKMLDLLDRPSFQHLSGVIQLILGLFPILASILVRLCVRRKIIP